MAIIQSCLHERDGLAHVDGDRVDADYEVKQVPRVVNIRVVERELGETDDGRADEVERDEQEEKQEVLVIAMAEAVVDVDAVVVEFLNAAFAVRAMERIVGLYHFAVEAEVLQVD